MFHVLTLGRSAAGEMKIRTEKAVIEEKVKENYEEKVNNERIRIAQLEERLCCLQKVSNGHSAVFSCPRHT